MGRSVCAIVELFTSSKKSTETNFVFERYVKRVLTTLHPQSSLLSSIIMQTGLESKINFRVSICLSNTLGKYN